MTVRPTMGTRRGTLGGTVKTWCLWLPWCNIPNVPLCTSRRGVSDVKRELYLPSCWVQRCPHQPASPTAVGLWDHFHSSHFDDSARHRFFRDCRTNFDQLPDHVQQMKRLCDLRRSLQFLELSGAGGCALHVPFRRTSQ